MFGRGRSKERSPSELICVWGREGGGEEEGGRGRGQKGGGAEGGQRKGGERGDGEKRGGIERKEGEWEGRRTEGGGGEDRRRRIGRLLQRGEFHSILTYNSVSGVP